MSEVLVGMRGLSVRYGDYVALENVDLDIYKDDFLGVIGPNGGGKTTLAKTIVGAVPYSGGIAYSPAIGSSHHARAIGYMPQQNDFDRNFPISVLEIVKSGLMSTNGMRRNYGRKDNDRAVELLEMTGITDIANRNVGEVSGGQLQRALLCRALIAGPRLLILDEPANFVDNKFEKELYAILRELNDRMAIMMVSHDLGTVTSVVKNIVCVNRHVHRHGSNIITAEQLANYDCPIQLVSHGEVPHIVLERHSHDHNEDGRNHDRHDH